MRANAWFVLRIKPGQSTRAADNVRRQGYEWYSPRAEFRSPRNNVLRIEPVFPGYAFARHPGGLWVSLRGTFGVIDVMMSSEEVPARVPWEEIEAWRARENAEGLVRLEAREFVVGEHVRVNRGVVAVDAIVEGMAARDRIYVLMGLLGGVRTEVDVKDVLRG